MKIIKNRITQIIMVLLLITGIGFAIIYNNKPVLAGDQVSMEVFNNKMKEVENKITTLEDNLNLKIENLENENKELKIEIEKLKDNKELLKISGRVNKIESWQSKFHEIFTKSPFPMSMSYDRWKELNDFKEKQ